MLNRRSGPGVLQPVGRSGCRVAVGGKGKAAVKGGGGGASSS